MSQLIDVHFSSKSNDWRTPPWLFKQLDAEFGGFDLDAAADKESALCARHYTEEMDALKQEWGLDGKACFLNPPYGRWIGKFVHKAHCETEKYPNLTVVMLIPARTDTRWWHAHCALGEVRFLRSRLKFGLVSSETGQVAYSAPAPFPSAIVVFGPKSCRHLEGRTRYVVYKEPVSP